MNYYKDYYALQTLLAKQQEYASAKQLAVSKIYQHLHDVQTALPLLHRFIQKYKNDDTIYLTVNDISSRLQAFDVCMESTQKALAHETLNAQSHHDFGTLLIKCKSKKQSRDILLRYLQCINEGHLRMIILSSQIDVHNAQKIIEAYFQSEAKKTNFADDYLRLGNFLVFGRQFTKALVAYKQTTRLKHNCIIGYRNLSLVYELLGDKFESHVAMGHSNFIGRNYASAIDSYVRALSFGEASPGIYEKLAQSYSNEDRFLEAAAICAEAIPNKQTAMLYTIWIYALQSVNQIDRALDVAERAYAAFPQEQYFKFQARLILPVIYKSEEDVSNHRTRYCRTMRAWSVKCRNDPEYISHPAIPDIKNTNFYLPYQGQNDLDINKEYGRLLHRIMTATYPQFSDRPPYKLGVNKTRGRIGYISAFCNWHTVGKLFLGWVQHHNSDIFEIYVYHLGHTKDFLSNAFKVASAHFVHFADRDLVKICESIRADDLDILVYLEFGMRPLITKLAALRLSRIQCLAWGHPVTSGLPTMDYFISSEMMEPPNGDNHYSEALVRLPNVGVCVPKPPRSISTKTRSDYRLSDNRTIYVFPHSLFKQLPQYDDVFPSIAKRNPSSEFVFIERETHSIEAAHAFKARVADAFKQRDLDSNEYIRFVPHQGLLGFLRLLSLSDVYLDCIGWSGGMTTLEALGCMLPVVTMPGEFMRGRHAYGCLKRIGISETIAQSVEDYVNVSVRLGLDEAWKETIISKQAASLHRLYDDRDCIIELERFYQTAILRETT